jgi:hypothetical protein
VGAVSTDQTYIGASGVAFGRAVATIFLGMVEGGMTRQEALEAIKAYLMAMALQRKDDE